jgi:hypothetical protein
MPGYSSVSPAATQGLPLYRCKCYATEPVYPQEGVTSLHGCGNSVERRQYAQTSNGVPAQRNSTCRPGSGVPRRVLTTHVRAATPGQPGVRAPGAWWCGSARGRRSVAVGRHGAVRQGRRSHRGAGGRAGVAHAASSVTVGPSRRRVRRALRQTLEQCASPLCGVVRIPRW